MDLATRRRLGRRGPWVTPLGFGGAAIGNLYTAVEEEEARATVARAFALGVRFFDTAPRYGYGLSERRIGDALRPEPRDEWVLSTKVGRLLRPRRGGPEPEGGFADPLPFDAIYDYSYEGVMRSFEMSLQRLGHDRVDVLLLHDVGAQTHGRDAHPRIFATAMEGGYRALDELRSAGEIGAVGMGVNEWEVCIEAMAHADFDCFLLAGRYTLLDQAALERFLPACTAAGISVIVGGPYNSGILASRPGARSTYDYAPAGAAVVERAKQLYRVCESHGVPLQAAALQFPGLHPAVASVIPGARSVREAEQNVQFFRHAIPDSLWSDLRDEGLLHEAAPTTPAAPAGPGGDPGREEVRDERRSS